MTEQSIFWPVCALAFLTFAIMILIPVRRFRAAFAGKVTPRDFKLGESARVPPEVAVVNRNYMNLLELPVLFYVLSVILFVTHRVDPIHVGLAWAYVGLRFAHSLIHLTYNNVRHRLIPFALSNLVLMAMWVRFALSL